MSEKVFKIILKVDLQCSQCNKKIKKTLCKLQDGKEKIRKVEYDEKKNTVTISGPFDPQKLIKKICCKACKVIQDIQIVEDKPPPPPPPPTVPPPPPPPVPPPPPPPPCLCPYPYPVPVPIPVWTPAPGCCCRPWYEACHDDCSCCSCGCVSGPGCKGRRLASSSVTCEFICEEQPATCPIM